MSANEEMTRNVLGATLSRGMLVKGSGALLVALGVPAAFTASTGTAAGPSLTLDPSQVSSWLEIHADNTILMRTGRAEMGQGSASAAFAQIVAEELDVAYDSISVLMGDTDKTPDGGVSAGFLLKSAGSPWAEPFGGGGLNLQRVAAYTRQALLDLAATKLAVSKD